MYNYKSSLQLLSNPFLLVLAVLIIFAACKENPSTSYDGEALQIEENADNLAMVNSNADFPVFHQVFNHDTHPWATKEDDGATGWCGSIEHKDRRSNGDINPAVGRGYATIMNGVCNEFWGDEEVGVFPELTSGPATTLEPGLLSTKFPASGYVQQLDIYLDPAYPAGNEGFTFLDLLGIDDVVFSFANTVGSQEQELLDADFVYFTTFVFEDNESLIVGDYQVDESGWYTFRHVFGSEADGTLSVDFELLQKDELLYTESIETALFGEETSDLIAEELGSAYLWFPTIADGVELPIDQHRLRPGK